jgi:hypothetical protein
MGASVLFLVVAGSSGYPEIPVSPPLGGPASGMTLWCYFIACGLIGEPVPPLMMSGGPQKKNS